ncbi:hypothetical protein ACFL14_02810 [Patescibacteria group bacterium]
MKDRNNEIQVLASFAKNKLCPHFFKWRNRKYTISSVDLIKKYDQDDARMYCFAAITTEGSYHITFNNKTFQWVLIDFNKKN